MITLENLSWSLVTNYCNQIILNELWFMPLKNDWVGLCSNLLEGKSQQGLPKSVYNYCFLSQKGLKKSL